MGSTTVSEIIGVFAAIVILAGLSVVVINGGKSATVIGAGGKAFSDSIKAATHPGK
jgi:hypothetical protein